MPHGGTSDIPHVGFTDHYIRVVKLNSSKTSTPQNATTARPLIELYCATTGQPKPTDVGKAYLAYYEQQDARPEYLALALQKIPDSLAYERSKALFFDGKYAEALRFADLACQQSPDGMWQLQHRATLLEALNRPAEAAAAWRTIYERFPHNAFAAGKAAALRLQTQAGNPDALRDAEQLLRQANQKHSQDTRILTNLGFVLMNSGKLPEGEQKLRQALALDPDYTLAIENLILLLAYTNRKAEAQTWLNRLPAPRRAALQQAMR
jgi:Flp pilus assembly protein TadD